MNKFIWTLQVLLALFFFVAGATKIITPKEKLIEQKIITTHDSVAPIKIIGIMEALGCLGMILPMALKTLPVLTPVAACGFCIVMTGALILHTSRGEYKILPLLALTLICAASVAIYRFKNLI